MKRLLTNRPSPALVIACLALFVSLGGVSYGLATGVVDTNALRNNTIRTQDLRNNDIRAIDIRNSTIRGRDVALNTLTGSDVAESKLKQVPSAAQADTAGNASALGGVGASGFARVSNAPFAPLGLTADWETAPGSAAPGYFRDGLGVVHLRGAIRRVGGNPTAGVLPGAARPATTSRFPAYSENGPDNPVPAGVVVEPDGTVRPVGSAVDTLVSLDGISFRAGN